MSKRIVISGNNLPIKFPLTFTLVLYLCLDKWAAPEWLWGIAITIMTILWAVIWGLQKKEDRIDLFQKDDDETQVDQKVKSKFQKRLDEMS